MLVQSGELKLGAPRWAKEIGLCVMLNPEANASVHDILKIPSTLTLDSIRESLGEPSSVSIWNLRNYITQLEQAGFSSRRHKVWFQAEMARPFFLMAMVLVAASFTMRHTRFGGTGTAVLTAILLGFTLYFVRSFAQILGENGQIPILLAAWAPPAAATFFALGMLLHAEDG
jgi:lipopolysaccharide export system permease protein